MQILLILSAALLAESPVTEISLQRTPCFGSCPVDKVVLHSNGSAEYTGTRFVELLGTYTGRISAEDFKRLAKMLEDKQFFEMNDDYRKPITDQATLITRATRGGKAKEVKDYGSAAPKAMQEIEKAIVEAMGKIAWKPSEK
jgi:hypothetical protein